MRGKPRYENVITVGERITPAHAGKTIVADVVGTVQEDHPRACGENLQYGY